MDIEERRIDPSDHDLARGSWPPPIVADDVDPGTDNIQPAASFIERVRAQSKILGLFASAGIAYGVVAAVCYSIAFTLWLARGIGVVYALLLSAAFAVVPSLAVGLPFGCVVGLLCGIFRRTTESWPLIGFGAGGCVSLAMYYFQTVYMGGIPRSTDSVVLSAIPAVLSTLLCVSLRTDYDAARQRLPLMAKLKQGDIEHSA